MSKQTLGFIKEVFERFLKDQNLKFTLQESKDKKRIIYRGGFSGFGFPYDSFDQIIILEKKSIQSILYLPAYAKDNKGQVAEFLSRANYYMKFGRFEMDFDDGEIRFHFAQNSAIFSSEDVYDALEDQIYLPPTMMERYARGIIEVIQGSQSPKDAFFACRK